MLLQFGHYYVGLIANSPGVASEEEFSPGVPTGHQGTVAGYGFR